IVAEESWHKYILEYCQENGISKFLDLTEQGKNRQLSILNGLEVINKFAEDGDFVFIHDAARPLLSDDLINRCINAVSDGNNYDGALPVLPMKDTVYYSENGKSVSKLLNRSNVYAGQAPEVFKFRKYYEANLKLLPDKILNINGSSEVAILAGMNIAMIEGDENNFKITTQADLDRFKEMVKNESLCPT
ncbi:MAG: 2-C-methyl-D-erythritol 4-phosphate cytidylyltransferase, partial [Firmicutes bacterium]|nr:2-C-methyl-D-erythritol 4-phosphate cytidylyltransferase [Bacillota bacterium]